MAIEHVTYTATHTYSSDDYDAVILPTEVPAGVSMTVVLTVQQSAGDALDCTGATVTMLGRPLDSPISDTLLATGAVSGADNNVLTFTVAKDTIPAGWAKYDTVRITWLIEGPGDHKTKIIQEGILILSSDDASNETYPYTEDVAISVETPAGAIDSEPGLRVILVDGTTDILPADPTDNPGQLLICIAIGAASNEINPNGNTINGSAATVALAQWESLILNEYSGNWLACNPTLTVP
ncbi:MAG: hypothetical protein GY851_35350 [bacterium]|nr:hypothetical protein [bacterium]